MEATYNTVILLYCTFLIFLIYNAVYNQVIQAYIYVCVCVCVCVCVYIHILFHYSLLQGIKYSSLSYTLGPCLSSILYTVVFIC